jgi:4-hydroxy-2-oxovalerate aldolase
MINILDCTIRDGSYAINFQWNLHDLEEIVVTLSDIGIQYIEIGNGTGLGAYRKINNALDDDTYIKHTMRSKGLSKIGAFFIPEIGTKEDMLNFRKEGGDFIRIGTNATETETAIKYIEYAKKIGFTVFHNLMKTYAISKYQLAYRSKDIINAGVDCIYIVDSAGGMLPAQVAAYFKSMKMLYSVDLGFHGHNNLLLANANSLTAIENGATFVDSTLMGLGRGAGNAQTESLVALLQKANLIDNNLSIFRLSDLSQRIISCISDQLTGISKRNIFVGIANFHDSNMPYIEKYSQQYNVTPEKLIEEVSKINIVNPSETLFKFVAQKISEGVAEIVYFPKFSHRNF